MRCNFDTIIERKGTGSVKWDSLEKRYGEKDLLPFWVADMDFAAPQSVNEAICRRIQHNVYGYTEVSCSVYEAICNWSKTRYEWPLQPEWISFTTGVVNALNILITTYTQPGDKVLIQPPVYAPFFRTVLNNGRQVVYNPLQPSGSSYTMDFDALESSIDGRTRMLILCNPHNPVGRVWRKSELKKLADICLRHKILIISDEIHADFVYSGHRHIPLASLGEEVAQNTITCMAPSKTFNLAGWPHRL